MKKNVLPDGYKSWIRLLIDNRSFLYSMQGIEKYPVDFFGKGNSLHPEQILPESTEIDIDFLKARAMDEILEFLPSSPDVVSLETSLIINVLAGTITSNPYDLYVVKLAICLREKLC